MNNDLGFLIIFIILPTVLIVSGFWLILIVRSDLRLRASSEASTRDDDAAQEIEETVETVPETLPLPPEPNLRVNLSSDEGASLPSPEEVAEDTDEEFWTPEPEPATGDPQPNSAASASDMEVSSPADSEASADDEHPVDESPVENSFEDTANLPDEWEVDMEDEADSSDEDSDDESTRPPRQPAAMMVPSTEHVRRRTGQQPRRTPTFAPRSTVRDEDSVESPDGG